MEPMRVIPFYVGKSKKTIRHIFVKHDPSNECALSIANIPPILSSENVKSILNSIIAPEEILRLFIKKSTAFTGDLTEGYRSGSIHFCHVNDCKAFFEKCDNLSPIFLDVVGATLPQSGIKKIVNNYVAKFSSISELLKSANDVLVAYEEQKTISAETEKRKFNEPNDDGWITVTKKLKNSFRGEIHHRDDVEQES